MSPVGVLAIGRSGLLYDTVRALAASGHYRVAALVTDEAYAEYDVDVADFEALAAEVDAEFVTARSVAEPLVAGLMARHGLEVGISVNWRFLIPGTVLRLLPYGVLNLHLGRLPDYKGNATVNWAVLEGEPDVHADVHRMEVELDAGDVLARASLPLTDRTYVGDVLEWSRSQAPRLFLEALDRVRDPGAEPLVRGDRGGLRCYPRLPEDGAIDWSAPAELVSRLVRASSRPYPGAVTTYRDQLVRVWRAHAVTPSDRFLARPGQVLGSDRLSGTVDVACGEGVLRIEEVDVDGAAVSPAEHVRGVRTRFGSAQQTLRRLP